MPPRKRNKKAVNRLRRFGRIRIIAGQWRGRKIDILDAPGLRPSPNRVREMVFNWLQRDIVASRCLDLFAGTGALGLEALSRGADSCEFVDSNPATIKHLQLQAEKLQSDRHNLHIAEAISWLKSYAATFDIIFLDPPFRRALIELCLSCILDQQLLHPNGRIYVETEKDFMPAQDWLIMKQKQTGQVQSLLLTRQL